MRRIALRGIAERKLRSALTAIAILLGVAMIAGTYIETDQIRNAFAAITKQGVAGLDVIITPKEAFSPSFGSEPPTLPSGYLGKARAVPGVGAVEGEISTFGHMVVDGEVVDTMGAPPLVIGTPTPQFDPTKAVAGRQPVRAGEVSVLEKNADDHGIAIGDTIGITTRHGIEQETVVGTFAYGNGGSSLGGTTLVQMPRSEVQRLFDLAGRYTSFSVIADPGVDPSVLADRLDAQLPSKAKVQTADENATETADDINDQIGSFLTPALLALAGAAVLVGGFIIFNTFSITVAQRMREFAMLRALGATRRQVLGVVTGEALVIGGIASALGLAAGIGFSKLLNALFDAVGFGIPRTGLVLAPRTVAIALGVGIGVTLISALVPALRAMRTSPVAAMSGVAPRPSRRRRRISGGLTALCLAGGGVLTAQGLFGSGTATSKLSAMASGAVLIFIGVALSARYATKPLAAVIGWPVERAFKTPGRLARENAERNPGRTATTAAALMVGLALVVFVAVFTAGLKSSIDDQINNLVRADLIVYSDDFQAFPGRTESVVSRVPGVTATVPTLFDQVKVNGEKVNTATDVLIGIDPSRLGAVYRFDWVDGSDSLLSQLGPNQTLIEEQFAKQHHLAVGDSYRVVTPTGGRTTLTAVGIYRDPTILQGSMSTVATLQSVSPARDPLTLLVAIDDSADQAQVQAGISQALKPYPTLKVENKSEYMQSFSDQLNQIVYLLYALLAMSIVISLFGIANSLFLSIHERTGELGVLRAVGATRGQLRRIIRYESVITAIIGGLLGTALGIFFAWLLIESLSEFGFSLSIPVLELVALMLVAAIVGVVGAIAPARRASKVDVLEALHYE